MKRKVLLTLIGVVLCTIFLSSAAYAYSVPFDGYTASVGTSIDIERAHGYTSYTTTGVLTVTTECYYYSGSLDSYYYRTASQNMSGTQVYVNTPVANPFYVANSAASSHNIVHNGKSLYLESNITRK
jgi:hypothetical protein